MADHNPGEDLAKLLKKESDRLRKVDVEDLMRQFKAKTEPGVQDYFDALKLSFRDDAQATLKRKHDLGVLSTDEVNRRLLAMNEFMNSKVQKFAKAGLPVKRKLMAEVQGSQVTRSDKEINLDIMDQFLRNNTRKPSNPAVSESPLEQIGFRSMLDRVTRPSLGNALLKKLFGQKKPTGITTLQNGQPFTGPR